MDFRDSDPQRFRVLISLEVEVTDRTALDAAALEWNDDLHSQHAWNAATSLLSVSDVPGLRVLGKSALPWLPEAGVYPAQSLPEIPVD